MANPFRSEYTLSPTPRVAGKLVCLIDFVGQTITGNDWSTTGNYVTFRPYVLQSGTYDYGATQRMGTSKLKYSCQHVALIIPNTTTAVGIEMTAVGLSTGISEDVNIRAHLVKETST